jgi:hypothetical protein
MMSDALKKHKISKEVLRNFRENVNEWYNKGLVDWKEYQSWKKFFNGL